MFDASGEFLTRGFYHSPILVIGPGRSGTSVLLTALGQHPSVFSMGGEAPFISYVGNLVYPFEFSYSPDYHLSCAQVRKTYLYDRFRQLIFETTVGKHYGLKQAFNELRHSGSAFFQKRYWCAKTRPDYDQCRGLIELYPNIKFVYIVRNGPDVIRSRSRFHSFRYAEFEVHCKRWAYLVEKYSYLSDVPQAIQVRHETLISEPKQFFQHIFSFVGLPYDGSSATFVKSNLVHPLDQPTRTGVDVSTAFKNRPPAYEGWSTEQKEIFKNICGGAMLELDYKIPF